MAPARQESSEPGAKLKAEQDELLSGAPMHHRCGQRSLVCRKLYGFAATISLGGKFDPEIGMIGKEFLQ